VTLLVLTASVTAATPAYALPPALLGKASALTRLHMAMYFAGEGWEILSVLLLPAMGVPARLRDWTLAATERRRLQGLIFLSLLLLAMALLLLPLRIYSHHLSAVYGLSVEGWKSWFFD